MSDGALDRKRSDPLRWIPVSNSERRGDGSDLQWLRGACDSEDAHTLLRYELDAAKTLYRAAIDGVRFI
ncbi:hypothetical protein [Burkholderia ubonensis]|uniref:hypothetical protein n=1 Tax=Burkholderia ubonensis TaxID=101571 RepID=UPI0012FB69B4|nr:hypothetical protein [Burkholderia ubonensis]